MKALFFGFVVKFKNIEAFTYQTSTPLVTVGLTIFCGGESWREAMLT